MRATSFDLRSGVTLGRNYYVVEFLGSGWEGEVYKVEERRTGIPRAAKIFYDTSRFRGKQLQRYARKLYKLRSCPIVTQYHHRDVARVGGSQVEVLVSDLVEGEMLSTLLVRQKGRKLTSFEGLHLLYALALGMEPVHHLGEYHGDIHSENILVKRRGLGFEVHLLDFFDLGRPTSEKIQEDVYDLISILYEVIGGAAGYRNAGDTVRGLIMGRKHSLIRRRFKTAGQLRLALDNLEWQQ
jgi:tRNA A-37 threonylcarbamoyl transferase component Bud32